MVMMVDTRLRIKNLAMNKTPKKIIITMASLRDKPDRDA